MKTQNKILVTGASGFIGKHVVSELLSHNADVRILIRPESSYRPLGVEIFEGNLKDKESILKATKGVDTVIHLAALKVDEPDSKEVNIVGTRNLIDSSKANNVKLFINISSSSTKIKTKGDYAETKDRADKIVEQSNIDYVILKPSIVYGDVLSGVFGSLARFAKFPITPVIGNGKCNFYPIHVEDLSHIIYLCTQGKIKNKIYDIGGPDKVSINQLIILISKYIYGDGSKKLFHIPKIIGMFIARVLKLFLKNPPITMSNILGSTQDIEWDMDKPYRDLGFTPRKLLVGIDSLPKITDHEPEIMLGYVLRSQLINNNLIERYKKATKACGVNQKLDPIIAKYPILINGIDAWSKLTNTKNKLSSKIEIANTLVECDPVSAPWLLPKDRSIALFLTIICSTVIIGTIKILFGLILYLSGFIKNHAR